MEKKKYRYLYVMKLEGNGYNYYVGHTIKTKERILKDHYKGERALTRNNKPIKIIFWKSIGLTLEHEAHEYSKEIIIELMKKFGIEEVRGGTWFCQIDLRHHLEALLPLIRDKSINNFEVLANQLKRYPDIHRKLTDPTSMYYTNL
ncbi:hypothetical protein DW624_RS00830 [Enterococcus hirae]